MPEPRFQTDVSVWKYSRKTFAVFFFQEKRRERKKKDHDFKKEQGREREKESNLVGALGSKKDERKGTVAEGG